MIGLFNRNVSDAINKSGALYESWLGKEAFVPEVTILESEDYNCGAVCNELEFARTVSDYYVKSLALESAEHSELELLINTFIDLNRRGTVESDEIFRDRFKFLVTDKTHPNRITKSSILKAIDYFIPDSETSVQLVEQFDVNNLYFQIRIEGINDTTMTITLDNNEYGFLDQLYLGGASLGQVNTYLTLLLERIKGAGIDFDVLFIEQNREEKDSSAFIGIIQKYVISNAVVKNFYSVTKNSNATVV
jgi:hypothetical protein